MFRWLAALVLSVLPMAADAQWTGVSRSEMRRVGGWETWTEEDRLYNTRTAYIATATFEEQLKLIIGCSGGAYTAQFTLGRLTFEREAVLNWRVEAGTIAQLKLVNAQDHNVLRVDTGSEGGGVAIRSFLEVLSRSDMLVFEITDGRSRARGLHDLHQLPSAILQAPECDRLAKDLGLR